MNSNFSSFTGKNPWLYFSIPWIYRVNFVDRAVKRGPFQYWRSQYAMAREKLGAPNQPLKQFLILALSSCKILLHSLILEKTDYYIN